MELDDLLHRLVAADHEYRAAMADAVMHGGPLIRQARQQLGLTQRELAEKVNMHFSFISKVENGHTPPSKPLLRGIAALLAHVRADEKE
jgi:ribosome-binding protein aMBF1 (putative translation factor)